MEIFHSLKEKIRQARLRANALVNIELLRLYWEIGHIILIQQKEEGWGTKVVDKLAVDLKNEFPDMKGLSIRNIKYMRAFAEAYPEFGFVQANPAQFQNENNNLIVQVPLAQISWYHHITLLDKVKEPETRLFYIRKTVENNWSRDVMVHQIESALHKRLGALSNNFESTLPAYQSDLAKQLFKDPYQLDFLMLGEEAKERDLETALLKHITKFLLELGDGFAFMSQQRKFEAGGKEFFIDLLFYHTKLRRHIIIELKIGEFEPEYVSKMNLYLGLADDQLKGEYDEPAIGLILCKTNNKIVAEYALRDTSKPIGIAEYKIAERLPDNIKGELPSIEDIEQKLDEELKAPSNPVNDRLKTIKERIKNLQTDEIQTPATYAILNNLYENGFKPLFKNIIEKFSAFEENFISVRYYWNVRRDNIKDFEELDIMWQNEEILKQFKEVDFYYSFHGFKKSGTEELGESIWLRINLDVYSYEIVFMEQRDDRKGIKKLYHQELNDTDIQNITDMLMNKVMDRIDWMLEYMKNRIEKN